MVIAKPEVARRAMVNKRKLEAIESCWVGELVFAGEEEEE